MANWSEIKDRLVFSEPPKGLEAEPPVLTQVLYDARPCEDCDKIIDTQRVVEHKRRSDGGWQLQCKVCKQYKNPKTGEFDCDLYQKNLIYKSLNNQRDK